MSEDCKCEATDWSWLFWPLIIVAFALAHYGCERGNEAATRNDMLRACMKDATKPYCAGALK